jgi:hypothetical protein
MNAQVDSGCGPWLGLATGAAVTAHTGPTAITPRPIVSAK